MQRIVDGMSLIFDVMKYAYCSGTYFLIKTEDSKRYLKSTVLSPFIEHFLECMAGTEILTVTLIRKRLASHVIKLTPILGKL